MAAMALVSHEVGFPLAPGLCTYAGEPVSSISTWLFIVSLLLCACAVAIFLIWRPAKTESEKAFDALEGICHVLDYRIAKLRSRSDETSNLSTVYISQTEALNPLLNSHYSARANLPKTPAFDEERELLVPICASIRGQLAWMTKIQALIPTYLEDSRKCVEALESQRKMLDAPTVGTKEEFFQRWEELETHFQIFHAVVSSTKTEMDVLKTELATFFQEGERWNDLLGQAKAERDCQEQADRLKH